MTADRFSRSGFLKSYALPVLFVLLIPAVGVWFAQHATGRIDSEVRDGILSAIRHDQSISAEDQQSAIAFYTGTPASVICRSADPELARLKGNLSDFCSKYEQFAWMRRLSLTSMAVGLIGFIFALSCVGLSMLSQQSQHYSFTTGWQILRVSALVQAVSQGIVATMLSYWMTVIWTEHYYPKLIFVTGAGAVALVFLMVKAIFTKVDPVLNVEGTLLTEQVAGKFWTHVRAMAERLGTEPPKHIIAGIDDNFFVTENPVTLNGTRLEGRTLFVSFSLLKFMEKPEADAVLAHELAHFSGDDTTYTKRMSPARMRYAEYLSALYAGGIWSRPLFHFMHLFWLLFQLSFSRTSRQREFRADAIAAETTSPLHMGRALLKVIAYASYRSRVEQALFSQNAKEENLAIAGRIATGFGAYASSSNLLGDLSGAAFPHPMDDHPKLDARLAAVRAPLVPSHYPNMLMQPVVESWLADIENAAEIEAGMWQAYEQRFGQAHEEALAWRYQPSSDEERAVVEKYFPKLAHQTKKLDGTFEMDFTHLRFNEWDGPVAYGEITECAIRESFGRKFLTIKLNTPRKKVELPLNRFSDATEIVGHFERYLARHRFMTEQLKQNSAA